MKNIEIPADEADNLLENGVMFDGSSVEGFARQHESDMYLKPDLRTLAMLPWTFEGYRSARIICDVYEDYNTPFAGDPRFVMKSVQEKARTLGLYPMQAQRLSSSYCQKEMEDLPLSFLDNGSYFDLLPVDIAEHMRTEVSVHLKKWV